MSLGSKGALMRELSALVERGITTIMCIMRPEDCVMIVTTRECCAMVAQDTALSGYHFAVGSGKELFNNAASKTTLRNVLK